MTDIDLSGFVPVKGHERYMIHPDGRLYGKYRKKILKWQISYAGYEIIVLHYKRKKQVVKKHRLLAQAFLPNPNSYPIVRHLNDVKTDNSIENLCWGTQKENINDAYSNGYKNKGRKFADKETVIDIFYSDKPQSVLSKKYNVSRSAIQNIKNKESYIEITKELSEPGMFQTPLRVPLTKKEVVEIFKDKRKQKDICKDYNIQRTVLYKIKNRITFRSITKDLI